MNSVYFNRLFLYFGILSTLFFSGCTSLPNEKIGAVDHRQVEYSLIENNKGPAIVVFENGLDGKMNLWNRIISEISSEATTFAYNRPGYGSSDPVSTPRDGLHIVDELRGLLARWNPHISWWATPLAVYTCSSMPGDILKK